MAKLNVDKLKSLARNLKENGGTVKKSGDEKQPEARKKTAIGDSKVSGRRS